MDAAKLGPRLGEGPRLASRDESGEFAVDGDADAGCRGLLAADMAGGGVFAAGSADCTTSAMER